MNTFFQEKPQVVKSVQNSDRDVLSAIRTLFLNNENFDLDPCYSTGKFYEDLERPFYKLDKNPQDNEVVQNDIMNGLPYSANTMRSIVFDPPFMFGTHGQTKNNIMTKRFTMFDTWQELETMYKKALSEFYRVLIKGGIVAFKCQDYTDSFSVFTHIYVYEWALQAGFYPKDLFILVAKGGRIFNSNLKQRHARKFHSYWWIFQKKSVKITIWHH